MDAIPKSLIIITKVHNENTKVVCCQSKWIRRVTQNYKNIIHQFQLELHSIYFIYKGFYLYWGRGHHSVVGENRSLHTISGDTTSSKATCYVGQAISTSSVHRNILQISKSMISKEMFQYYWVKAIILTWGKR